MERNTADRILVLQEAAMGDAGYRELLAEYRMLDRGLLDVLPSMTPAQRQAVMDYVGCAYEISRRLLKLSCASVEKS